MVVKGGGGNVTISTGFSVGSSEGLETISVVVKFEGGKEDNEIEDSDVLDSRVVSVCVMRFEGSVVVRIGGLMMKVTIELPVVVKIGTEFVRSVDVSLVVVKIGSEDNPSVVVRIGSKGRVVSTVVVKIRS